MSEKTPFKSSTIWPSLPEHYLIIFLTEQSRDLACSSSMGSFNMINIAVPAVFQNAFLGTSWGYSGVIMSLWHLPVCWVSNQVIVAFPGRLSFQYIFDQSGLELQGRRKSA